VSKQLTPFADDTTSHSIGDLTIENGTESIALYGNATITRDKKGLAFAEALSEQLATIVATMKADNDLPAEAPKAAEAAVTTKPNPFA
jgi:hypothetical protein